MRKRKTFIGLFLGLFITSGVFAQQDSVNLALDAAITTSHVSPWETLGAVNDGVEPTSSTKTGTAYGNWNGEGDYGIYNWVQYDWTNAVNVSSTAVYWWDDNPTADVGIAQPDDAYIEYWNGVSWIRAGNIGTALNMYNQLYIGGVWTQRIRITMKSPAATGILEWKVFGQTGGDCEATSFGVSISVNGSSVGESGFTNIIVGDDLVLSADEQSVGQFYWSGPDGFSETGNEVSIEDMQTNQSGTYTVMYINECGSISESVVYVTVALTNDGSAYTWPAYDPPIYYDFRDEFPSLEMPTKDLEDCNNIAGRQSSGWWTFVWGPNARSLVTENAITPMLERFNKDFAYFRDTMGWPPDKRAKRGYRSGIYLYGSGLCTDNADTTALGGWQGATNYQGESWPMVLASYYPVYSYDPACPYGDREGQMGAMIHEGIHALLADLPGAKSAAWFQEGGNTWLQQEMESRKSGDYSSMGFLNAGAMIAPFMPIECYSGWLQDGSFGGPSAEGVNMFDGGQQICTWRNLLGGNQYGNLFPVLFSQIFGDHSVAWIWRYCHNRVLDGIADTLGDHQMRRLIMEYRAKQALVDFGVWTTAARKLLDNNFGSSIKAEWQPSWLNPEVWKATPYVKTWINSEGLVVPEQRTTPGWSGANIVPLITEGDIVKVDFIPIGKNLGCQLCYRAEDGSVVYGQPVFGGETSLKLEKKPANNVVFVVVTNTDYIYEGEKTRKAHFDYRLRLGEGVKERAHWDVRWYRWNTKLNNITIPTDIDINKVSTHNKVSVFPNPVQKEEEINIRFENDLTSPAEIKLVDVNGKLVAMKNAIANTTLTCPEKLNKGFYFMSVKTGEGSEVHKLVVQ
ncbi:T9SS type A sorting domain-containing protein [Saccharicrinis sp. FJH62]|uniref:T9SS type A sorting domain-containing protein n=1 Tax=Saccharicrinis sp. FJH62 TaxID=3344657 RepID=UPI0035D5017B